MQTRREFVAGMAGAGVALAFGRSAHAQQSDQFFNGPMEQNAYLPVKLAARAGAAPSMTDEGRDDLEHRIKCQCGCVLDVYTCRTTDFSCSVSPAMHADVMGLVTGGYTASEILAAFQSVYGERVLMAPVKQGFNLLGYAMPFAVLIAGGAIVGGLIRKWGRRSAAEPHAATPQSVDATEEELDELAAAVKDDS